MGLTFQNLWEMLIQELELTVTWELFFKVKFGGYLQVLVQQNIQPSWILQLIGTDERILVNQLMLFMVLQVSLNGWRIYHWVYTIILKSYPSNRLKCTDLGLLGYFN